MPATAVNSARKTFRHTYIRKRTVVQPKIFDRKSIVDHSENGPMVVNESEESDPDAIQIVPLENEDLEE